MAEYEETSIPPMSDEAENLFRPYDEDQQLSTNAEHGNESVTWTASEFIAHEKDMKWYISLACIAILLAAGIYVLTHDVISAVVIVVGALMLGYYGARQPRELAYSLAGSKLRIGDKHYLLNEYRSFSVTPERAFASITFMPLKRFAPALTIYYAPVDEAKIIAIISSTLPYEEHKPDALDNFMRRIRF